MKKNTRFLLLLCALFARISLSFAEEGEELLSARDDDDDDDGVTTNSRRGRPPRRSGSSSSSSHYPTTQFRLTEEEDDEYRWGVRSDAREEVRSKLSFSSSSSGGGGDVGEDLREIREDIQFETEKLKIAEEMLEKEEEVETKKLGEKEEENIEREEGRRRHEARRKFAEGRREEESSTAMKWPLLRQHESNYDKFCIRGESAAAQMREEMEKLRKHAASYEETNANGNVVIFEAYNPYWNGFGNNMRRWLNLFMVTTRFDAFATYFDFGACGMEEYGRNAENDGVEGNIFNRRGHDQSACQFDPGMFFKGDGFDWQWTPKRAKENPERLSLARATRNATILCEEDVGENERDCRLYDDKDLTHDRKEVVDPSVKPLASSGRISREEIDRAEGLEERIKAARADWLREWLNEEVERDVDKKGVRVKITINDVFVMQREGELLFPYIDNDYGPDGPELPKPCFNRHFFHPRENVKEAIEQVFEKSSSLNDGTDMKKWRSCAAIHLRTGFADYQAEWVNAFQSLSRSERDALEAKYPCSTGSEEGQNAAEQFVDALDETFRRCEPDYSNERICTMWHQKNPFTKYVYPEIENEIHVHEGRLKTFDEVENCCGSSFREPDVLDAMESCGFVPEGMYPELEVKKRSKDAPASPVRAALTCALRAAKFHAQSLGEKEDSDDEAFGVFLLGDSPTFIKAVPKFPKIGKYFAHQPDPDTVGVTMEDNDCSGTSCVVRKKGEKHLSWLRSVVDAYVASLCEVTVQLPGSSFANGAIHQLRAPSMKRTSSAFHWSGEVVLGQHLATRDETTKEVTRDTKIGYDSKLENYVALGTPHCKTIDS